MRLNRRKKKLYDFWSVIRQFILEFLAQAQFSVLYWCTTMLPQQDFSNNTESHNKYGTDLQEKQTKNPKPTKQLNAMETTYYHCRDAYFGYGIEGGGKACSITANNIKYLSKEQLQTFNKYWWILLRPQQFSEIVCLHCGNLFCCLEELSNCTRPYMCNKALSKSKLVQKNCKKILWHAEKADFSWEWCSIFPFPDVYSYCLSAVCHQGYTAPLAGPGLRPPFLLFKLFLS